MKVLIVTATKFEANAIIDKHSLKLTENNYFTNDNNTISLLIAGVGVPSTVLELAMDLSKNKYDLIINAGIAGTYENKGEIGNTYFVKSDFFGDTGYYNDKNEFINVFKSDFNKKHSKIFKNGKIYFNEDYLNFFESVKAVDAVTVNSAEQKIPDIGNASIETMEGAAVGLCAARFEINCIQIRTVSNIVGITPKEDWKIREAVKEYSGIISRYLSSIS